MPKLGVVVFGASTYDNHRDLNNSKFLNSAKEFVQTFSDPAIIPGSDTKVLNLYNDKTLPNDTQSKIIDFVGEGFDNVIIYYCGHGDVSRGGDYRVLLRSSRRDRRHSTLLDIVGLIRDIQIISAQKKVYFVLDSCYSGAAISEMQEFMDAGGASALIDRTLSDVLTHSGTAVFAASGGLEVALAKKGDKTSLFTGAFLRCLREGLVYKSDVELLSWLDIKDEIVRLTRDRLGPNAPLPKLTSFTEKYGDITRIPFFKNKAYVERKMPPSGGGIGDWEISDRTAEALFWKVISEDTQSSVIEDFLKRFPAGMYAKAARGLLINRISGFSEADIGRYLRDHPETVMQRELGERRARLKWDTLRSSNEVAALEQYIAAHPESEFAGEARDRLAFLEKEQADLAKEEAEADARWECIRTSTDRVEFEQFLERFPRSAHGQSAWEILTQLIREAEAVLPPGPEPVSGDHVTDDIPPAAVFGDPVAGVETRPRALRWTAIAAGVAALIAVIVVGNPWRGARYVIASSTQTEADLKRDLESAGTDIDKLKAVVEACNQISCSIAQQANARLTDARFKRELDEAGTNVGKLQNVVDRCRASACYLADTAGARLATAQAEQQARTIEANLRQEFDAAGADIGKLRTIADRCRASSCSFAQAISLRLSSAETAAQERTRQTAALDAAGTDLAKLRSFMDGCRAPSCLIEEEGRSRLERAEGIEMTLAVYDVTRLQLCIQQCRTEPARAEAERRINLVRGEENSYRMARGNAGMLQTYIKYCVACKFKTVAQSELADLARPKPVANFNANVNYDMDGGDIRDGDALMMLRNSDLSSCQSKCQGIDGCVAYSFDKWNRSCYLKDKLSALVLDPHSNTYIRQDQANPGLSTAMKRFCHYANSAIAGDEASAVTVPTAAKCEQSCGADQACVAYTFRSTDYMCRLFRNASDRQKGADNSYSGSKTQYSCN